MLDQLRSERVTFEVQPASAVEQKLHGQGILITGGASGLGLALAERLSTLETSITIADVNVEEGIEIAARMRAKGHQFGHPIRLRARLPYS